MRTVDGVARTTYIAGTGPGVLVMHEVPGLHPDVTRFAWDLVEAGFTVWMPVLFGEPGQAPNPTYLARSLVGVCISAEFTVWRTGKNSPITDWLRGLARQLSAETDGPVGALGMCVTGGFALALVAEDCVVAPVLSQPSLPFGVFPWQQKDLGIDHSTLTKLKDRVAKGLCVLGLRYTGDLMVPARRFARLRDELGQAFRAIELPSTRRSGKHSVLAMDRHEPSVAEVIAFFREHVPTDQESPSPR